MDLEWRCESLGYDGASDVRRLSGGRDGSATVEHLAAETVAPEGLVPNPQRNAKRSFSSADVSAVQVHSPASSIVRRTAVHR